MLGSSSSALSSTFCTSGLFSCASDHPMFSACNVYLLPWPLITGRIEEPMILGAQSTWQIHNKIVTMLLRVAVNWPWRYMWATCMSAAAMASLASAALESLSL